MHYVTELSFPEFCGGSDSVAELSQRMRVFSKELITI